MEEIQTQVKLKQELYYYSQNKINRKNIQYIIHYTRQEQKQKREKKYKKIFRYRSLPRSMGNKGTITKGRIPATL